MLMVTQPYHGAGGEVLHQPGEMFAKGTKLPEDLRVTEVEVDPDAPGPAYSQMEYGEATATQPQPNSDHGTGEAAARERAKALAKAEKDLKAEKDPPEGQVKTGASGPEQLVAGPSPAADADPETGSRGKSGDLGGGDQKDVKKAGDDAAAEAAKAAGDDPGSTAQGRAGGPGGPQDADPKPGTGKAPGTAKSH
jgi:hypothetical protein